MKYSMPGYLSLISIPVLSIILLLSDSQAQTINPEYISISDGLASIGVYAIHQDQYGLLWFGTRNGLQQYNGISFKTYKTEPGQPNSLMDNEVYGIEEDEKGNIWVATRNGISKYDRQKDKFVNYDFNEQFELAQLNGGRAFNLLSDSQNRLWAATYFAGVLLYNPSLNQWEMPEYQFEGSAWGSSRDPIFAITEDKSGGIWAGNLEHGLYSLSPGDSLFRKALIDPSSIIDFTENPNHITSLYSDHTNILWITTRTGVYKYNPNSGVIKTIKTYDTAVDININYLNSIQPDLDGNIWISNHYRGILKFDGISDQYQEVSISGSTRYRDGMFNIMPLDFIIDNSGIFWFGTIDTGLLKYNPVSNPFKFYSFQENNENGLTGDAIYGLLVSKVRPNTLYVGTRGGWLNIMDRETQTFERVTFSAINDFYGGTVRSIAENEDGSLWLGTWGDGLIRTDSEYREIERYTHNPESFSGLSNNSVRVLKKDTNGDLWIGTWSGLNVMRAGTTDIQRVPDRFSKVYPDPLYELVYSLLESEQKLGSIEDVTGFQDLSESIEIESPGEYIVITVGEGSDESLLDYGWIENEEGDTLWAAKGVNETYFAGGSFRNRILIEKLNLESGSINLRYVSNESHHYNSWVSPPPRFTEFWGIALIKVDDLNVSEQIGQYLAQSSSEIYINANNIQDIEIDGNTIWVTGSESGLDKIDTRTNTVTNYTNDPNDLNSISSNSAFDIYRQSDGILWIATHEGLNRFDPQTEIFTRYTEDDGLPTNYIESVLPGENGGLWISTLSGLSHMITSESLERVTFINYDASDGLGGDTFINQVAEKTDDGTFYFGGLHGLNEFINIEANLTPPRMLISDFKISNRSILEMGEDSPIDGSFFKTGKIDLSHTQNNLSFEFAALHYANPSKNQYAHMLDGFDEDWIYDNRNFASYTNLNPGNYTFRIRGSNSDGIWNEEGKSLLISIAPPWWRTFWAYGLYLTLLIAGIVTVDKIQRKRLLRKQIERARENELKHAKEIEQAYEHLKSAQDQLVQQEKLASLGQLTAGIAHEIKNPLNFVNNFSEVSLELVEEAREEVKSEKAKVKSAPSDSAPHLSHAAERSDSRVSEKSPFPKGIPSGEGGAGVPNTFGTEVGDDAMSAKDEASSLILEILDDIEANLRKIHEHGSRADGIVKSMLQHSRGGDGKMEPTPINPLVKEYVNLAFHGMRAGKDPINVDIQLDLDESVGEAPLIAEDFSRVILNLCNNSFDAIREKLTVVKQQLTNGYKPNLTVRTKLQNDSIVIEIEDNGPGIPEEIKDKILQPFFTTKKGTQGTGLGLSITNDIVKAHGGKLSIDSDSNGSIIIISLPKHEDLL